MYVFGDSSTFSTCFEFNQDYGGAWLFGKFCYWVEGIQMGDYELGTSLRDVLFLLRSVVTDNGNRENLCLFKLPADELYRCLNSALYAANSEYESIAQEECWARFRIHLPVDIFDDWKVYLVECPPMARIVYSYLESEVVELNIPSGIFDQVVTNAFNTLFEIYESEMAK